MNYEKTIKDFASGKIDKSKWVVVFDNDSGYWSCLDDSLSDDQKEAAEDAMEKEYGSPDGYQDVVDIAEAAGIPSEWC